MKAIALALLLLLATVVPAPAAAPPPLAPQERALARGLAYLARTQKEDGTWADPRYRGTALSALAALAFLDNGVAPGKGAYGKEVERAVKALARSADKRGLLVAGGTTGPPMYHHGLATLALARALPRADADLGKEARPALEKAVQVIVASQSMRGRSEGGWRYQPQPLDGDLSVTVWQLLALEAARKAGVEVPDAVFDKAGKFVRACAAPGGLGFRYMPGGRTTQGNSAGGLLGLCVIEGGKFDPVAHAKAIDFVARYKPRPFDQWFLLAECKTALLAMRLNDPALKPRLKATVGLLLERQNADGSWRGQGNESVYGPTYATALAVLALRAVPGDAGR